MSLHIDGKFEFYEKRFLYLVFLNEFIKMTLPKYAKKGNCIVQRFLLQRFLFIIYLSQIIIFPFIFYRHILGEVTMYFFQFSLCQKYNPNQFPILTHLFQSNIAKIDQSIPAKLVLFFRKVQFHFTQVKEVSNHIYIHIL